MEYHKIYNKIGAAYIRVSDERQDEYSPKLVPKASPPPPITATLITMMRTMQ